MFRILLRLCLMLGVGSLLAACASEPPLAPVVTAASMPGTDSGYRLESGDRMRITVFGEDRLSGEFSVNTTGDISYPLLGDIPAAGRTLADVQTTINNRLAEGYIRDPRVTAELLSLRPFFILGEVARPGQIPFSDGLTIRQAIAAAGGFTYRAKRDRVYIMASGTNEEVTVDLEANPDRPVRPGDVIRVGERFF